MKLTEILEAVSQTAGVWAPLFPPALLVSIGAGFVSSVVGALKKDRIPVVDDNGNPVDPNALEAEVQARWSSAIAKAQEGQRVAQDEIDLHTPTSDQ